MSTPKLKGDTYVVIFATIICLVCSLFLSATASALKRKQDYNVELDRKINVLKALGVSVKDEAGKSIKGADVDRIFQDNIEELVLDGETGQPIPGFSIKQISADDLAEHKKLPLYMWKEDGEVTKYAFPVFGHGLWSTIYGYLALEKDLSTIAGITFYRHGETPGLGGECEKDWFQNNFKGKKVYGPSGRLPFEVVKGTVVDRYPGGNNHAVDGISGATLTGKGITHFLNADLDLYERYFKLLRKS